MEDSLQVRLLTKLSQEDKKRFELEWVLPMEPGLSTHVTLFDLECYPPHDHAVQLVGELRVRIEERGLSCRRRGDGWLQGAGHQATAFRARFRASSQSVGGIPDSRYRRGFLSAVNSVERVQDEVEARGELVGEAVVGAHDVLGC